MSTPPTSATPRSAAGIQEGKTNLVSTGWTRGYKPSIVGGTGERFRTEGGFDGRPARASAGASVTSISGNAVRKLEPAIAAATSEVVAFKRDYEERAVELAEEIAEEAEQEVTALFSDKAAAEAAAAKSEARKVEAERRARSIMQGIPATCAPSARTHDGAKPARAEKCDTCGPTSGCS